MTSETNLRVKAKNVHVSAILPPRSHTSDIVQSVRIYGQQQPLIVRPIDGCPGEYELIDGQGRLEALDPEQEVLLDVRTKASDAEVFKISEATTKRTNRSAYENSTYYDAYVEAVKKEDGEKGAVARVAKESLISESELSQYLAIKEMFDKLSQSDAKKEFPKLQSMGINKLYELTKLVNNPKLSQAAQETEQKADCLTLEGINDIVNNTLSADTEKLEKSSSNAQTNSSIVLPQESEKPKAKTIFEKISKMTEELITLLPQVESELPQRTETLSPEKQKVIEKISTSMRRLLFYARKLAEP
jgi:hypothetical protein